MNDPPDRPDYTSGIIIISTADGQNIIVDKLLIDAYAARGNVLYENNGVTPSWESAGMVDRGKLFAQLGIGFIEKVEVYVKNTGSAQDLVLGFSNRVDGPELFTKTISCPTDAVGAWRAVNVREWWWHDKCFPYVKSSGANISVAYDAEGPFDEFVIGTDRQGLNRRLWIRLTYYGLPAGYVPIGGTVNAIIVPNISSAASANSVATTAGVYKTLLDTYGAGQCQSIYVKSNNMTGALYIYCDEVQVGLFFGFDTLNAAGFSCATPQITLLSYDETNNIYAVLVSIPYSFLKHFKVQYLSSPAGSTIDYRIVYSKIS